MNPRILLLAEQANLKLDELPDDTFIPLEKFAELVVLECIDIINPTEHHRAFAQNYLGDVDGIELLDSKVYKLKQHFGVLL